MATMFSSTRSNRGQLEPRESDVASSSGRRVTVTEASLARRQRQSVLASSTSSVICRPLSLTALEHLPQIVIRNPQSRFSPATQQAQEQQQDTMRATALADLEALADDLQEQLYNLQQHQAMHEHVGVTAEAAAAATRRRQSSEASTSLGPSIAREGGVSVDRKGISSRTRRNGRASTAPRDHVALLMAKHMQDASSSHRQVLSKQAEVGLVEVVQEFLRLDKRRVWLARQINRRPTWEELAAVTNTDARDLPQLFLLGRQAKTLVLQHNVGLVTSFAAKYLGLGVPMPDLMAEGTQGLLRALETFDASKGFKLSTYASWWIKVRLHAAVRLQTSVISLPYKMTDDVRKMRYVWSALVERLGREPKDGELAAELGWDAKRLEQAVTASTLAGRTFSIESSAEGGDEMLELQAGGEEGGEEDAGDGGSQVLDAEEFTARSLFEAEVARSLASHSKRGGDGGGGRLAQRVLRMRHGFGGADPMTLAQVASALGMTAMGVRSIEYRALSKLRNDPAMKAAVADCLSSVPVAPIRSGHVNKQ